MITWGGFFINEDFKQKNSGAYFCAALLGGILTVVAMLRWLMCQCPTPYVSYALLCPASVD